MDSDKDVLRLSILYVDDEQANLDTFRRAFGSEYAVTVCSSGKEALQLLEAESFALLIADQRMPGLSGIELCERAIAVSPQTLRLILTAYTETDILLNAINRGHVHDYIVKPWRKSELKPILEKSLEIYRERSGKLRRLEQKVQEVDALKEDLQQFYPWKEIIGASSTLQNVLQTVMKVAATDATVLLTGETGTGKELMARAIHQNSKRATGPFVPVHCAALAENLVESELFGHEKGAFTGAIQTHIGSFEKAEGGTVFLDEVSEIPPKIQVELLRVLQEKEIQRVGGGKTIRIDARVVGATNKDLEIEVREGRFREDLFYRLQVIPIRIPPLRARKDDIPLLAAYFLEKFSAPLGYQRSLSPEALTRLSQYDWPGNVRELENILERAVILSQGQEIGPEELNLPLEEMWKTDQIDLSKIEQLSPGVSPLRVEIRQQEAQHLAEVLRQAGGNISEAARLLNLPRSTVFYRLKKCRLL
ncbi:MAG TPA: DNA-binding response regulator [Deltaproteobacteria bacterium]|nr:DNA-binding response regulator [Deltaproteobacteria bacterium]